MTPTGTVSSVPVSGGPDTPPGPTRATGQDPAEGSPSFEQILSSQSSTTTAAPTVDGGSTPPARGPSRPNGTRSTTGSSRSATDAASSGRHRRNRSSDTTSSPDGIGPDGAASEATTAAADILAASGTGTPGGNAAAGTAETGSAGGTGPVPQATANGLTGPMSTIASARAGQHGAPDPTGGLSPTGGPTSSGGSAAAAGAPTGAADPDDPGSSFAAVMAGDAPVAVAAAGDAPGHGGPTHPSSGEPVSSEAPTATAAGGSASRMDAEGSTVLSGTGAPGRAGTAPTGSTSGATGTAGRSTGPTAAGSRPVSTLDRLADTVDRSHDRNEPGSVDPALADVAGGQQASTAAAASPALAFDPTDGSSDGGSLGASGELDVSGLAGSISRTLNQSGGNGRVLVTLHPPELGQVQALLTLRGDVLHVALSPERTEGHDAIADALSSLHEQLSGGGVEVNVTLGQPGGSASGQQGSASTTQQSATTTVQPDVPTTPGGQVPTTGSERIHLVL